MHEPITLTQAITNSLMEHFPEWDGKNSYVKYCKDLMKEEWVGNKFFNVEDNGVVLAPLHEIYTKKDLMSVYYDKGSLFISIVLQPDS